MSILKKAIDKIPLDKKDHFLLGVIIGFPLVLFFGFYGGLTAIGLVGAKELVYDKWLKKGNPDLTWENLIGFNLADNVIVSGDFKATGSTVNLSNLPTSSAGLSAGDLWNNSGVVNIV